MYPETILQWIGACAVVFGILAAIGAVVWLMTSGRKDHND